MVVAISTVTWIITMDTPNTMVGAGLGLGVAMLRLKGEEPERGRARLAGESHKNRGVRDLDRTKFALNINLHSNSSL